MDGLGTHWELWALASGGLSPMEVIRIGTIFGAEAIRMVMKNGRLYQGDDLQEIWPRKRTLPAFWWATETPDRTGDAPAGR